MSQPATPSNQSPKREDPKPAKLWVLILGAGAAVVLAAGIAYWVFLYVLDTYKLVPFEAARTAVTLIGVPTAAGAVFVALRSLRLKERQLHTDQLRLTDAAATYELAYDSEHEQRRVDQERELRSRYVSAGEQIGSPSAAVRLAGVNAMAQLADDWADQRQACVDVLCAYLRLPEPTDLTGAPDASDGVVRRTVQRLLAEGFRKSPGEETVEKWPDMDLDLRGAVLRDCHMPFIAAKRAYFSDVTFVGKTMFTRSRIDRAFFMGASFSDAAVFSQCVFGRAVFEGCHFHGSVRFRRTQFSDRAQFIAVTFEESIEMKGATSSHGISFAHSNFSEVVALEAEGYDLTIHNCRVKGDPIPNWPVKVRIPQQDDGDLRDEDEAFNESIPVGDS